MNKWINDKSRNCSLKFNYVCNECFSLNHSLTRYIQAVGGEYLSVIDWHMRWPTHCEQHDSNRFCTTHIQAIGNWIGVHTKCASIN